MNVRLQLRHGSQRDTQCEHGRRGGIGCFDPSVDQYRANVNSGRFKQQIRCQHHNRKAAKDQKIAVYLEWAFPSNELYQSQNGKFKGNSDWNQTQPICPSRWRYESCHGHFMSSSPAAIQKSEHQRVGTLFAPLSIFFRNRQNRIAGKQVVHRYGEILRNRFLEKRY